MASLVGVGVESQVPLYTLDAMELMQASKVNKYLHLCVTYIYIYIYIYIEFLFKTLRGGPIDDHPIYIDINQLKFLKYFFFKFTIG